MQRQKVNSSNISSIGYDEEYSILEVEFNSGSIYQYMNVPKNLYAGIMSAASHGSYLNYYIKDRYTYREI
jgi:hypothetical protein